MGLIQVMKHLEDIKAVGHGIAVAFVATVYGVGSANIFFLPAANKLRARTRPHAAQGDGSGGRGGHRRRPEPHADRLKLELRSVRPKPGRPRPARQAPSRAPQNPAAAAARAGAEQTEGATRNYETHAPSHENHERWLVSYADFITLLFAFFVVMFASTQDKSGRTGVRIGAGRLGARPIQRRISTMWGAATITTREAGGL